MVSVVVAAVFLSGLPAMADKEPFEPAGLETDGLLVPGIAVVLLMVVEPAVVATDEAVPDVFTAFTADHF